MPNTKVFRDPVHTTIAFNYSDEAEALALRLIDAPEIQRLRHIRQLGLANYVYHGVEHSRFSHTMGVTHLARRFYRSAIDAAGVAPDHNEYALVLASALLHDVGHAPFSHALEKVLGVAHEKISVQVVRGESAVNKLLRDFGGAEFVENVAGHITDSSDLRTVSIISSQLDADRADYILRDGYFAGIPNAHFDLERIVQKVRLDDQRLLFESSAQQAIEGYFIARYHLYIQLYYHRTVRSAEALLRATIQRAKDLRSKKEELGPIGPVASLFEGEPNLELAALLTDHDLWVAFHYWARHSTDKILADLSRRLVQRKLLKVEEIAAADSFSFAREVMPEIARLSESAGLDPAYYVLHDTAKDTPYKLTDPASSASNKSTRLRTRQGSISALEVQSGVVKALQDEAYQMTRVCFPGEIRDQVAKLFTQPGKK